IWHQGMQNLAAAEVSMRPDASSGLMNSVSVLGKPDLRDGLHMAFSSSSMVTRSLQPTTLRATTASASPATGGQVTVFGHQKYLRTTGAPNQYPSTFLLPPWALAPFVLHIQNGAATGGNRVSSATIVFNGVQIAGPSDFSQQVTSIDRDVSLSQQN